MIWGVFPLVERMSWESHLLGALTGTLLAYIYRHEGPQKPPPFWETEDDEIDEYEFPESEDEDENQNITQQVNGVSFSYKQNRK